MCVCVCVYICINDSKLSTSSSPTVIELTGVRVATVHLEVVDVPVGVRLSVQLKIVFVARVTGAGVRPKVAVDAELKALGVDLPRDNNRRCVIMLQSRAHEISPEIKDVCRKF